MTTPRNKKNDTLRFGMLIPLALLVASAITGCLSYYDAKQNLADDLNEAIISLANENKELWTGQDTISALRQMHEATHKPMIYRASDMNFRNAALKDDAYFTLALVDRTDDAQKIRDNMIASDSVMLVPADGIDGLAVQVQGFADCSMASVFSVSDQTLPGFLLILALISMSGMFVWRKKQTYMPQCASSVTDIPSIDGIRLTPMQRQLTMMLLDAPERKVDKQTLCSVLWDGKSNADESLYTLVRRTKAALSNAGIEIVCNRGESYELRIKH